MKRSGYTCLAGGSREDDAGMSLVDAACVFTWFGLRCSGKYKANVFEK